MASTSHSLPQRGVRGSQKLLENLPRNGEMPTVDEIKKALAFPATINYTILNWLTRGIPPAYLELDATLQCPANQLGELVNQCVRLNDSTLNLNILINGIPTVDFCTVRICNTEGEE